MEQGANKVVRNFAANSSPSIDRAVRSIAAAAQLIHPYFMFFPHWVPPTALFIAAKRRKVLEVGPDHSSLSIWHSVSTIVQNVVRFVNIILHSPGLWVLNEPPFRLKILYYFLCFSQQGKTDVGDVGLN